MLSKMTLLSSSRNRLLREMIIVTWGTLFFLFLAATLGLPGDSKATCPGSAWAETQAPSLTPFAESPRRLGTAASREVPPAAHADFPEHALAILSADQREKITKLSEALQLHAIDTEAVNLNLIDADFPTLSGRAFRLGQRSGTFEASVSAPASKTIFFRGRTGADPAEIGGDHIIIREQIVK